MTHFPKDRRTLVFDPLNTNTNVRINAIGCCFKREKNGAVIMQPNSFYKGIDMPILEWKQNVQLEIAQNTPMYDEYLEGLMRPKDRLNFYALLEPVGDDKLILYKLIVQSLVEASYVKTPDPHADERKAIADARKIVETYDEIICAEAGVTGKSGAKAKKLALEQIGMTAKEYKAIQAVADKPDPPEHKAVTGFDPERLRFAVYNPKKKHAFAVVGNREAMKRLYGSDVLFNHENPLKVFPLIAGNTAFNYNAERTSKHNNGEEAPTHLRILIGPQEYVKEHPVSPGCVPIHDGCIHLKHAMKIRKRVSEYEEAKRSEKDREASYFHIYGSQWRFRIPALGKAKCNCDPVMMGDVMARNGYGDKFDEVDGYASISVIKSWPIQWKPGMIIEIPLTDLRIVAAKTSDGNSSIGGQASARLDYASTEKLLIEHGTHERAKILRGAIESRADDFEVILKADKDGTLGDAVKEYIQYLCYASPDSNGVWRCPMYEGAWRHALARMYSYYFREVIKCRCSKLSLYIQDDLSLDRMEEAHFDKTGKRVNFFLPPRNRKMRAMINQFKHMNIGRNPMVGPGNIQGMIQATDENGKKLWNTTTDTLYISARANYAMFGDVDGDSEINAPSNVTFYPCVRRPAPPAEGWKDKWIPPHELAKISHMSVVHKLMDVTKFTVDAAVDTGRADLISRLVVTANKIMGTPVSVQTLLDMAEFCELQIQKMKRKEGKSADAGAAVKDDVVDDFIAKFWDKKGKVPRGKFAPKEYKMFLKTSPGGTDSGTMTGLISLMGDAIPFNRTVPHHVAWDVLQGVQPSMNHKASAKLRDFFDGVWQQLMPKIKKGYYEYVVPTEPSEEHIAWAKAHNIDVATLVPSRRIMIDEIEERIFAQGLTYADYDIDELRAMTKEWVPFENPGSQHRVRYWYTPEVVIGVASSVCEFYNAQSFTAKDIQDNHERRMAFTQLRLNIRKAIEDNAPQSAYELVGTEYVVKPEIEAYMASPVGNMPKGCYMEGGELKLVPPFKRDRWGMTPKDYFYRAITCYVGKRGFGIWNKRPDMDSPIPPEQQTLSGSLGGSAFFYMPEEHLVDYAMRMNPGNPWAMNARKELIVLKKKAADAEVRRMNREDEEDDEGYVD